LKKFGTAADLAVIDEKIKKADIILNRKERKRIQTRVDKTSS
jgi:hypothetical protein